MPLLPQLRGCASPAFAPSPPASPSTVQSLVTPRGYSGKNSPTGLSMSGELAGTLKYVRHSPETSRALVPAARCLRRSALRDSAPCSALPLPRHVRN